jgi:hypothetical protein
MRRIISIFLLIVVVTAGAHPTLVVHFCGGELYAVGFTDESIQPCCAGSMDGDTSCCRIHKIQISTDDYQHEIPLVAPLLPTVENIWLTSNYALNRVKPDNSLVPQHLFPPGSLNKQSIDLLTYICIYRI